MVLVILVNLLYLDRVTIAHDLLSRGVVGKVLQLATPCHGDSARAIIRRFFLSLLATVTGVDWEPVAMQLPGLPGI